jgi:hypothetical protein
MLTYSCSPVKLSAELADAWITGRTHLAKQAAVDIAPRIEELGMIENIEELSSDLNPG